MYPSTLVLLVPCVSGHLVLNIPQVWGINDAIALEQPLDATTTDWICAGKQPTTNAKVTLVAGQTYSWQVMCGELGLDEPGCLVGDWHTGTASNDYSGCALGIAYDTWQQARSHYYLAFTADCPKRMTNTSFTISTTVQNCENCVCSWAWAPSREYSSPAQFYHNCFYCSVSGGQESTQGMKPFDFINVRDAQYTDVTYNDIKPVLPTRSSDFLEPPIPATSRSSSVVKPPIPTITSKGKQHKKQCKKRNV